MIAKDLKPIPKYIIDKIRKIDEPKRLYGHIETTYYSYLTKFKKDLAQVTVACKMKDKQWFCKQVVVRPIHSDVCYVKDIEYSLFGYVTGWYKQGVSHTKARYDDDRWYDAQDKYYNVYSQVVNKSYALKVPKYKYCALNKYPYLDIVKYLRIYEEYPQAEYLVKMDLSQFATNKAILKQIGKDKNFRKWIVKNKKILQNKYGEYGFISSRIMLNAYKQDISILNAQKIDRQIKELNEDYVFRNSLKDIFSKDELVKFINYLKKQEINTSTYWDYVNACEYLELNMNEDKNRYPHNFKYWHDVRIDQYHTAKALKDEQERKELYTKFEQVANKYLALQRNLKDDFVVIIARSPQDLVNEGEILHHCVGRMNYDQKFAREESLIFFVRNKSNQQTPFVTLEYSLKNHKILQCYADHDTKPNEEVLNFVNKKWLPYANRKLRKIHTGLCA